MDNKERLLRQIEANDINTTIADFSNSNLTDEDLTRLIAVIPENKCITSLNLLESGIQQHHIEPLLDALKRSALITEVSIQKYNDYSDKTKLLINEMHEKFPVAIPSMASGPRV